MPGMEIAQFLFLMINYPDFLIYIASIISGGGHIGGIKRVEVYKKRELISSHTGRRKFISNCILQGINTSSIILMSGHKSLKVFQGYVK